MFWNILRSGNGQIQMFKEVLNVFTKARISFISFQILQHVRLPLLSPKFLVGVVGSEPLIRSSEQCRDLLDEAKNYLLLPQERSLMQGPRTRPRRPITRDALFAVGGLVVFLIL